MKLVNLNQGVAEVKFNKAEIFMLARATGGAVFKGTEGRDIPVLSDWSKSEAEAFEALICATDNGTNKTENIYLNKKELVYLARIHHDHMLEMDEIEYPILVGYTYNEAEQLLNGLYEIINAILLNTA